MMANMAIIAGPSLNGTAPVNICIHTKRRWAKVQHTTEHLQRTSIMTIAKAKISASLLYVPSFKTSGAAHRAV
jgi:hypothetical protein